MDLSLILSIAFFVLSIPTAIAANLLTPKIKNWWATSSVSRAKKRLAKLESEEKQIAKFVKSKDILIIYILKDMALLILSGISILVILLLSLNPEYREFDSSFYNGIFIASFACYLMGYNIVLKIINQAKKTIRFDSYKIELEKTKESLNKIISQNSTQS